MDNKRSVRLGTRASALALFQARQVEERLRESGINVTICEITTRGDSDQETPIHRFGTTGIFTATLDRALLTNEIDIAVHSLKDYPTNPPEGLHIAGWLPRSNPHDALIIADTVDANGLYDSEATIATGSARRRAQWLHRYPRHRIVDLRGNVPTRLNKIVSGSHCDAGILASAGLERLGLSPNKAIALDWMIPAPAQGVIGIACRRTDSDLTGVLRSISNENSMISSHIEREFLQTLEGGCSAPVGAFAQTSENGWRFSGCVLSPDGTDRADITDEIPADNWKGAGAALAVKCLSRGGLEIMKAIRNA